MSRAGQIALITAGAAVTGVLGYCVYFDYMRRNSAEFRKGLRKQQKKVKQAAEAKAKEQAARDQRELTLALVELELETPPTTPEQMEVYFQEHVATAEKLAAEGPENYVKAATHFYRALRVYPQPVELLMIYQKVCPEPVFQLILKLTQLTAAAGGAGTSASARAQGAAAVASVADIDDTVEKKDEEKKDEEKEVSEEKKEAVTEEIAKEAAEATEAVAEEAAAVADEVEKEEKADDAESEGAPSNNGSGASGADWEKVSEDKATA